MGSPQRRPALVGSVQSSCGLARGRWISCSLGRRFFRNAWSYQEVFFCIADLVVCSVRSRFWFGRSLCWRSLECVAMRRSAEAFHVAGESDGETARCVATPIAFAFVHGLAHFV